MQIQQISIFVENKSGRLAEITEALAAAKVDIRAVSIADTSDFGKAAGLTASLTSVIAMGIDDQPGEFAKALRVLADNKIGVEYMYAFISREHGKAFVILRVDDSERAVAVLKEHQITILSAEEIYGM